MPLLCRLGLLLLSACSSTPLSPASAIEFKQHQQLVVVVTEHWHSHQGQLTTYQFDGEHWQQQALRADVVVGKNGLAWGIGLHPVQPGLQKHEGDGRAPAGLFRLSAAFGYLPALDSKMPYQQMTSDDFCIDVPDSPWYNQTVNRRYVAAATTAGSTEPMRRDLHLNGDQAYQKALFIDHNLAQKPAAGSCIFMHLWQSASTGTAGCTALGEPQMTALLGWLKPEHQPLYLLLPKAEYQRLGRLWQLPMIVATH